VQLFYLNKPALIKDISYYFFILFSTR